MGFEKPIQIQVEGRKLYQTVFFLLLEGIKYTISPYTR